MFFQEKIKQLLLNLKYPKIYLNFFLGIFLWLTMGNSILLGAILKTWNFNSQTNQLELTIESTTNPKLLIFDKPTRIVLDLPNTALGTNNILQNYSGFVREIRISQFKEGVTRIVMEFVPEITLSRQQVNLEQVSSNGNESRWLLKVSLTQNPISGNNQQNQIVTVPPLNQQNPANSQIPVIEFGQPLPKK